MKTSYFVIRESKSQLYSNEEELVEGFTIKSRNAQHQKKLIIFSPALIKIILTIKIDKRIKKFMAMLISDYDESSEEGNDGLNEILNQSKRFRSILKSEYKKYLDNIDITKAIKKITIIERETIIRMQVKKVQKQESISKGARR